MCLLAFFSLHTCRSASIRDAGAAARKESVFLHCPHSLFTHNTCTQIAPMRAAERDEKGAVERVRQMQAGIKMNNVRSAERVREAQLWEAHLRLQPKVLELAVVGVTKLVQPRHPTARDGDGSIIAEAHGDPVEPCSVLLHGVSALRWNALVLRSLAMCLSTGFKRF